METVFASPRCRAWMVAALPLLWVVVVAAGPPRSQAVDSAGIATPAVKADVEVRALDILVVLYTRSFSHSLTRSQLERLHEEVLEFVEFYRGSVGDAVEFRTSLLQIDRELGLAEVSEVAPGRHYLSREDVEDELVALGMDAQGFDEVIVLYAWNNANPAGATLAYGGGAVGPDGSFLGDAGYNSIGVFAWDPGRISQIMIHEVLHNIDDMFSMSGMPDAFRNSDEMSRNMSALLKERPGAFLPQFDDDEMLSYAERELANRATYPWSMQLVYYRWMLERTPRAAWLNLDYGRTVTRTDQESAGRSLYDRIFLSRENQDLYLPVVSIAPGRSVVLGADTLHLERREYRHTDFDGRVLFRGDYSAGWIDLPEAVRTVRVGVGGGVTEVVRLAMGEIVAPPRTVIRGELETRAGTPPASAVLPVEVVEPAFGARADAVIPVELSATVGGMDLPVRRLDTGRFAVDLSGLPMGRHELRLVAAEEDVFIPERTVTIERRSIWNLETEDRIVTGNGQPLDITLRIGRADAARGAEVSARVAGRTLALEELEDGRYSATVLEGLPPGLDTVRVRAELASGESLDEAIPIYVEPQGWIEVPQEITADADGIVQLEVRVRDRMGEIERGAGLPIALVAGSGLLPLREADGSGVYRARVNLPAHVDRVYVIGLEGSFERRVVAVTKEERKGAAQLPEREWLFTEPEPAIGFQPPALAPRAGRGLALRLDGDMREWRGLPAIDLGPDAHVLGGQADYGGADDLSGSLSFAWDSVYLYVAGELDDDSLTTGAAWTSDRVNLFLDLLNDNHPLAYGGEAPDAADWQRDDVWIYAHIVGDGDPPYPVLRMGVDYHGPLPGGELVSRRRASGWSFEMRVPWTALPEGRPFVGAVLGLQAFVSDGDGGGWLTEVMWSDEWGWSPDGGLEWEIWRLGRLVLTGGPAETARSEER